MRPLVAIGVMALAAIQAVPAPHVNVVRVDVIVSDARGRPVENLTPADFAIAENGVAQPLDSIRFVKIGRDAPLEAAAAPITSALDEQQQAARDGTRLVAILLDEYHVSAASTERVRDTLARFVDRDLGPRDLVAVLKPLDSLLTIRMTRDREQIRRAIGTFQGRLGE